MYFAKVFQTKITDEKPEPKEKKKPKPIPKESKKRKVEIREYSILRRIYLGKHKECEVRFSGCTLTATEIHHDQGRGIRLNDIASFVAICRNCHLIVEKENLKVKQ